MSHKMERKLEMNHYLVLFLKSYHLKEKVMPTHFMKWLFFASGYSSSAAKVGRALSDLHYPVNLSELGGAAKWASNIEQGNRF